MADVQDADAKATQASSASQSQAAPEPGGAATSPAAAAAAAVHISTQSFSDAPADTDKLGFEPYVRAVAWFLIDPKTRPPLTLSIEGPWGSGKSSFMLQLA